MRMDITPYVDALRQDLAQAARAMGPEAEQALSHAAAEVTNELDGISVEVRLQGREPVFVVLGAGPVAVGAADLSGRGVDDASAATDDAGDTSRITLRLSEALKGRAEELAARRGQSLNTWIVGAVRAATSPDATLAVGPGAPGRNRSSNKRVQGWVR
jgi:hypothetical protein